MGNLIMLLYCAFTAYVTFPYTGTIVQWTVPQTGLYNISAYGAFFFFLRVFFSLHLPFILFYLFYYYYYYYFFFLIVYALYMRYVAEHVHPLGCVISFLFGVRSVLSCVQKAPKVAPILVSGPTR